MGLYDNYKLQNSQPISQYVGSAVPELMKSQQVLQERYDIAATTSDKLRESVNSMATLPFSADRKKGEELKTKLITNLDQYAKDGNYEDAVRKVQRDALNFTSEYTPLQKRYQEWTAYEKAVKEDKTITDPATKAKILSVTRAINEADIPQVGPDGRTILGSIKTMPYAADVDIVDKVVKYVNNMHAKTVQGNYQANGQGKLVSRTIEQLTAKEIQSAIRNLITTDKSVQAMFERDYGLDSFGKDMNAFVQAQDTSYYDSLMRKGVKKQDIASTLKSLGMTVEEGKKTKVYESQIAQYKNAGLDDAKARDLVAKSLYMNAKMDPYLQLAPDFAQYKNTVSLSDDPIWKAAQDLKTGKAIVDYEKEINLNLTMDQPTAFTSSKDIEQIRALGTEAKLGMDELQNGMSQDIAKVLNIDLTQASQANAGKMAAINSMVKKGLMNPAEFEKSIKAMLPNAPNRANELISSLNLKYRQPFQVLNNKVQMASKIEANIDREIGYDFSVAQKEVSKILGKEVSAEEVKRYITQGESTGSADLSFLSVASEYLGFSTPTNKLAALEKNITLIKARSEYLSKRDQVLSSGKVNYGFKAIVPTDPSSDEAKVMKSITNQMVTSPAGRHVFDAFSGQPLDLTEAFGKKANSNDLKIEGVYPTMDIDAQGRPIFLISGFNDKDEPVSKPVSMNSNYGRIQDGFILKGFRQAGNPNSNISPNERQGIMQESLRVWGAKQAPSSFNVGILNSPGLPGMDYERYTSKGGLVDIEVKKANGVFTIRDTPRSGSSAVKQYQKSRNSDQTTLEVRNAEEIFPIFGSDLSGLVE